jgi:hypothetical protein
MKNEPYWWGASLALNTIFDNWGLNPDVSKELAYRLAEYFKNGKPAALLPSQLIRENWDVIGQRAADQDDFLRKIDEAGSALAKTFMYGRMFDYFREVTTRIAQTDHYSENKSVCEFAYLATAYMDEWLDYETYIPNFHQEVVLGYWLTKSKRSDGHIVPDKIDIRVLNLAIELSKHLGDWISMYPIKSRSMKEYSDDWRKYLIAN